MKSSEDKVKVVIVDGGEMYKNSGLSNDDAKSTHIVALENSLQRNKRIAKFGKKIVSSLKFEDVIDCGLNAVMELTECDKIDIGFLDNTNQFHCHESVRGKSDRKYQVSRLLFDEYDVMSSNIFVKDKFNQESIEETSTVEPQCVYNDKKSVMVLKLNNDGKTFGRIAVVKKGYSCFKKHELDDSKDISEYLSIALSNCRNLYEQDQLSKEMNEKQICYLKQIESLDEEHVQLKKISFTDELTGLKNRRFYEKELSVLNNIENMPLGILVADINSLKVINDAFGHHSGDLLISGTARALKDASMEIGSVARVGGDEFCILVPNSSPQIMQKLTKTINKNMSKLQELPIVATVSIGVAIKFSIDDSITDIISKAENEMYEKKLLESKKMKQLIVSSLKDKIKHFSSQNKESVTRLKSLSRKLDNTLGLDRVMSKKLEMLVELHNIGEIGIPKKILNKLDPLSLKETDVIKSHVKRGYRIANASPELNIISEEILCHHEHWDGNGYPRGIKGKEIPYISRIFAVIDAYNSMVSERKYRKKLNEKEAIFELRSNSGGQFDQSIVEIFIEKVLNNAELLKFNKKN